jgi:phosphatidylglycerol---prolipoprotein diacylglyceryl transferase
MIAYIDFPTWLKPEVFGFLNLSPGNMLNLFRWYGMMYIIGIVLSYFQTMYLLKHDPFKTLNKKLIDDYYFWAIIGMVLGGRTFSCLVYDLGYYSKHLTEILIPIRDGQFVGFQGMAYHGAVIGVFIISYIFVKLKKVSLRELCDLIFPVVPLGYTFGRIANFINQELWGRITSSPIGVLFPRAELAPIKLQKTVQVVNELGWKVDETAKTVIDKAGNSLPHLLGEIPVLDKYGFLKETIPGINLPRHPSQLYEALFEGIILFLLLWFPARKYKPFKGFMAFAYLAGYSIFRIGIEFFREPDAQFMNLAAGKYTGYIFGAVSMGQLLSLIMLLTAIGVGYYCYILSKKEGLKPADLKKKK